MAEDVAGPAGAAPVRARLAVAPELLRRQLDPGTLAFADTSELEPLQGTLGQGRALEAIAFGLENDTPGFNLFVAGLPGTGRETTLLDQLQAFAADRPRADDWVYVHDFVHADRPRAIRLPAGRGRELVADIDALIAGARERISRAFLDERYDRRRRDELADVGSRRDAVLHELETFARDRGFAVEMTPTGFVTLPVLLGRPLSPGEVERLPEEQRQDLERRGREVQEEMVTGIRRLHQLELEAAERVRGLDREVAVFALDPLFHPLREKYRDVEEVIDQLDQLHEDIPKHLPDFRSPEPAPGAPAEAAEAVMGGHLERYRVNLLIGDGPAPGAPVVVERNPTYYNLVGRVEYRPLLGTMVTDFRQIKAGALHRANGGFLVLDALDVLGAPFAWEALKRALRSGEVRIENLGEQLSAVPMATLSPEPVALRVKVVLFGSPSVYLDFDNFSGVKSPSEPSPEFSAPSNGPF